jgi:Thioredoxin
LLDFAKNAKSLNIQEFQGCVDNQRSLGLVLRDLNFASANDINGTPSLFINGPRIPSVKDVAELRQLIAEAKKAPRQVALGIAHSALAAEPVRGQGEGDNRGKRRRQLITTLGCE